MSPQPASTRESPAAAAAPAGDRLSERRLFRRHARFRDLAARDELFRRFLPLAQGLARRYAGNGTPYDDLAQVASIGLLKAIDRFDPEQASEFRSFAVPTILGELKRYLRDFDWTLRPPRAAQERALLAARTADRLAGQLGRTPTVAEVASASGLGVAGALEGLEAAQARRALSLDASLATHDDEGARLGDAVGYEDGRFELVLSRDALLRGLLALPARERQVLQLRFFGELSQSEIAARIGVSQTHVSRLVRRALERTRLAAEGAPEQPAKAGSARIPADRTAPRRGPARRAAERA